MLVALINNKHWKPNLFVFAGPYKQLKLVQDNINILCFNSITCLLFYACLGKDANGLRNEIWDAFGLYKPVKTTMVFNMVNW